jgi:thiamine biosynthesis lipoprotein
VKRFIAVICVFSLGFVSCGDLRGNGPVERTHFLMDTVVRVSVYDKRLSEKKIGEAIDRVFRVMEKIEAQASIHVDTSEVFRVVEKSGKSAVRVSPEIFWLLKKSLEVSDKTWGAFDVSVGVVKDLWGFDTDHPSVPDSMAVQSLLPKVNYREIALQDSEVFLRQSGMRIDLGGVAKGYIIDQGIRILQEEGIRSGLVEAGGDLRVFGTHPDRKVWRIGIRHPRGEEGELFGVLETDAVGIATSGDYERYFVREGKRYHHILDPKTGFPSNRCISVTVVAECALLADAYATAVFVLGPVKGMALIKDHPSIEGMIIYEVAGQCHHVVSEGFILSAAKPPSK